MELFVYKLILSEKYHDMSSWDQEMQTILAKHAEYLQMGIREGKVLMVARSNGELKDNFGLAIFRAKNIEEAILYMSNDPVVKNGIMKAQAMPFLLFHSSDELKSWQKW